MGRVRETLHDVLRQTDAVLLALCVASTLYGMVLIASATSFRGTLKYVAVQGLGLLIGLMLYFFLSSIDVFELAKQWKWLLGWLPAQFPRHGAAGGGRKDLFHRFARLSACAAEG